MIRMVPDPVVVASAGPLPSATLHETTVVPARVKERSQDTVKNFGRQGSFE